MPANKFMIMTDDGVEPLAVTVGRTEQITGESRSQIYARIGRGEYEAVKSGTRTLILFDSIKRRFNSLPRAKIKPPRPRKPRAIPRGRG